MRLRVLALPLLALALLAGCGKPGSAAGSSPDRRLWDPDCGSPAAHPTDTLDHVYEVNGQLDELAQMMQPVIEKYPAVFGGLVIETECNRVVVYRLASAAFDRDAKVAIKSDRRLLLRPALHSQAELLAFSQKVQADVDYWKSRGIDVNWTGPAPDGSSLIVGTTQVEKVRAEFPDRYGPDIAIYVEEAGPAVPI